MNEVKQVFGDLNSPSNGYGSLNVSDSDSDMPNQENNKKGICSKLCSAQYSNCHLLSITPNRSDTIETK